MKNFTLLFLALFSAWALNAADLPLDFESGTYEFTDFDGGVVTVIDNPHQTGINTSSKVAQMIKNAGQNWGGSWIALDNPMDFSEYKIMKMKIYSPRAGAKVLLKVENNTDGNIYFQKEVSTTVANEWEDLEFDFSAISTSLSYQKIVLIFDIGTMGDGSANFTYLFDDIRQVSGGNTTEVLKLPLDFESATLDYAFTDFDGGVITIADNPDASGINTSAKVAQMVKNAGQAWGGSYITLNNPIDFSAGKIFKMKVHSPRVGAKVLLKVENISNSGINYEKEVATTVANVWEELEFDYSGINEAQSYQKIILIFDNGTMGDGSANFTYYFDDIMLSDGTGSGEVVELPLDFESTTLDYPFTDFDGGVVTIIDNPDASGINTSAKVAQMVKYAGQTWGGSYITLNNPINFSSGKIFKMKVYSPRIGAKVLLKVENISDGGVNYEKEVATTVADEWEDIVFDYSDINEAQSYQKIILIFDNGTMGDGSANFTYLFDDIRLTNATSALSNRLDDVRIFTASNQVVVKSSERFLNGNIEVFNITGKSVSKVRINNTMEVIPLTKSGFYIVRLADAEGRNIVSQKVVK